MTDVYLRCHICSGPHPVWLYRTADIQAAALGGNREVIQNYSNQWQVCYSCALLIDNDDSDTLTNQSAAVMGWQRGDPQDIVLRAVQKAIVLTRHPQRTLLILPEGWVNKIANALGLIHPDGAGPTTATVTFCNWS